MALDKENEYYILALKNNQEKPLRELYDQLFPIVKQFVTSNNGDIMDAEDAFQSVLMQISARCVNNRFDISAPLDAYILKACRNQWFKKLKRAKTYKNRVTDSLQKELNSTDSLVEDTIDQERYDMLDKGLTVLSENCQNVLRLYFEEKSGKDIMTIMDYKSETTVRQRIFKCKKKLIAIIKAMPNYSDLRSK